MPAHFVNDMAQFLTVLASILILAAFKSILCSASRMPGDRRNRASSIELGEYSSQHLGDANEGRSAKGTTQNHNQSVAQVAVNLTQIGDQEITDSVVDKQIRNLFATNLGPGLHLFNNTPPFVNEFLFKSYNDAMTTTDESRTYSSLSQHADNGFFEVEGSSHDKQGLVYNDTYEAKHEDYTKTYNAPDKRVKGLNKENPNKGPKTHISSGLTIKKEPFSPATTPSKPGDEKLHINDCLEEDEMKNNKTYCSNLRNYPRKDHLEELIEKKSSNLEFFFDEDIIEPEVFDGRISNDPNEEYFCRSRQVVIYPKSGQNRDYEWFYIVNSDKFKQGIRIEECLDMYAPCGEHVGLNLPNHYETSCEQHYITRTLVAYDGNNDALIKETFRFPASCKCVLRSKLN